MYFLDTPEGLPSPGNVERAADGIERWREHAARLEQAEQRNTAQALVQDPASRRLLETLFGNSPFLTRCVLADPAAFLDLLSTGPDAVVSQVNGALKGELAASLDRAGVAKGLRVARRRVALATALADISGHWPLERVTGVLSDFAAAALSCALSHLLRVAEQRGQLGLAAPEAPERDCGYVVLAMGKLGAGELNYSSDIDLIILYDPHKAALGESADARSTFVRLTQALVSLIEERTADGHVFRTDLRLRPDPGAMPVAISYNAAMAYYESMGQNWERAAMIKVRPLAGDLALGRAFVSELRPFVWRKNLDFWAIDDIHSIKRQINTHRSGSKLELPGHNVKLGRGGIREIEFFVQTQQLIFGGRDPSLRKARTTEALAALAEAGRVDQEVARELTDVYRYLRRVEHRLQMVDDQQTHSLPKDEDGLARIACFLGYDDSAALGEALLANLRRVERHYGRLFEEAPSLSGPGNLVFTGGEAEPDTLATLKGLGFGDGNKVFQIVRSWHHGRFRATRSTRSRELLTELMPALLAALGKTPDPDGALAKFDEFLSGLPAGVQLFSLLTANPMLLELLAEIMGSAPTLAERLSRTPGLLDAVLTPGFFGHMPDKRALQASCRKALEQARDFQDVLDLARRWVNDEKFQVGVNALRLTIDVDEAGRALSHIADSALQAVFGPVQEELARAHGRVPGAEVAILALGKYGGEEMTPSSDLDLIFIYDLPEGTPASDGAKPLDPTQYFARLAQRFIAAITSLTAEGRLYEIDMRLRPSGNAGPIATSFNGFQRYHRQDAWTWERMALTRARVVIGDRALAERIEAEVRALLTMPQDEARLLRDVAAMRARIQDEFPAKNLWDIKYLRGGLVDLDFLAQYLQLAHGAQRPEMLARTTEACFANLCSAGLMGASLAQRLIEATHFLRQVQMLLRLTASEALDESAFPDGLKATLARASGDRDFGKLKAHLTESAEVAFEAFREMVELPAEDLSEAEG